MALTSRQRQFLKRSAHNLKPVVLLGANGLTEGVLAETDHALEHHELIKVKVPAEEKELRDAIAAAIVRDTGAEVVQQIGKVLILYRPASEPKLQLPR